MWNVSDLPDGTNDYSNEEAVINVGGDVFTADVGEGFADRILSIARQLRIGKFKVVLNGQEIDNDNAPDVFEDGDVVTIVKFEDPA